MEQKVNLKLTAKEARYLYSTNKTNLDEALYELAKDGNKEAIVLIDKLEFYLLNVQKKWFYRKLVKRYNEIGLYELANKYKYKLNSMSE